MDGRCERHQFEAAIGLCDFCGDEYCGECLVYPFGQKKPPMCIPCTIKQSGLRSTNARRRKLSKQERKEMEERIAGQTAPTVLSATEAALMSAGKPGKHASAAGADSKEKKRGRFGRKKGDGGGGDEAPAIRPVAEAPRPSFEPTPAPAPTMAPDDEASAIPSGVGMTAPGADDIDWSKPFEVKG
jgi:hypothetical protein